MKSKKRFNFDRSDSFRYYYDLTKEQHFLSHHQPMKIQGKRKIKFINRRINSK